MNMDRNAMYYHQWIWLDMLYKLLKNFFQISEYFFE